MDKTETNKDLSEDMARESLIALSYGLPETDPTAEMWPKNINGEKFAQPLSSDGEDIYRSKLISISDSSPPEANVLPTPSPGDSTVSSYYIKGRNVN